MKIPLKSNLKKSKSINLNKISEAVGVVNLVMPLIKDGVDIVNKKKNDNTDDLVYLPNVVELNQNEAKEKLEKLSFSVSILSAKPNLKYKDKKIGQVIDQYPKTKRVNKSEIIKLYVIDEESLEKSNYLVNLINVEGLEIEEAKSKLLDLELEVTLNKLKPNKKFAEINPNTVISMRPSPNVFLKNVKKGTVIRLYYVAEEEQIKSKLLIEKNKK